MCTCLYFIFINYFHKYTIGNYDFVAYGTLTTYVNSIHDYIFGSFVKLITKLSLMKYVTEPNYFTTVKFHEGEVCSFRGLQEVFPIVSQIYIL